MRRVKNKIKDHAKKSTQQLFEEERVAHRVSSNTTLPDYNEVKERLKN